MTQLPVGKYWCFAENAQLVEDTYLAATRDNVTAGRLHCTLQYGLLILPSLSSLLAVCNAAAILCACIREYCPNGPHLIAYCLLKLMAACLVWIMALPRFIQVRTTTDAGQRVSAQMPALLMAQQAFRLAATWLLFFLLVTHVFAVDRLTRSLTAKCGFAPHINNAIQKNMRSCKCITTAYKMFTNKTCQLFCTKSPLDSAPMEQQGFRRTYGYSILCIMCVVIFSTLLTAPQIGNYLIESRGDSLGWCVAYVAGSSAYEYALTFLIFLLPAVCFLILLLTMSCRLAKIGQKPQRHVHCLCHYLADNCEDAKNKNSTVVMWESKFISLICLVEFVSWVPIQTQTNLNRLAWIRNDGQDTNAWILCELVQLAGDLLVQIILFAKTLFESTDCRKGKPAEDTAAEGETRRLPISRQRTSEATEYGADSLVQLYSSQVSSQKSTTRKSALHVRMSPSPLPSPDYTYGGSKMSEAEEFESPSVKLSCFQRDNGNGTTNTNITTTTTATSSPFFYAFPNHEDIHQCQFTPAEEYFDSHGVLVSRL